MSTSPGSKEEMSTGSDSESSVSPEGTRKEVFSKVPRGAVGTWLVVGASGGGPEGLLGLRRSG